MPRTVTFLLMRHPEHKDDVVTPEGEEQILRAADEWRWKFGKIHYAFCTEKKRAKRTAEVALEGFDQPGDPVHMDPCFGFQYIEDEMNMGYPFAQVVREVESLRARGLFVSAQLMFEELWPPARIIRHVLRATMKHWAEMLANPDVASALELSERGYPVPDQVTVLVGNHASNVYAALEPDKMDGYPPFCSICRYDYVVNDDGAASLQASELLVPSE